MFFSGGQEKMMTDLRKAAEQVLDVLATVDDFLFTYYDCEPNNEREIDAYSAVRAATHAAFTALRERLAQPEQEPVAKVELMLTGGAAVSAGLATRIVEIDDHLRERLRPGQLLYTAPPQREWVDLTDEQIEAALLSVDPATKRLPPGMKAFAQAVGVALKGENT